MARKLLFVALFVIGSSSSALAGRMYLSQEGYQDMGPSGGGADFGPATTGLTRGGFDDGPSHFDGHQGPSSHFEHGPSGHEGHQGPSALASEDSSDFKFNFRGPSGHGGGHGGQGGDEPQFVSIGRNPAMFGGFNGEDGGAPGGGGSLSGDEGGQGWGNQGPAHEPHFGGQRFQDGDTDQFERDQDSRLQAQLLKDDDMGGSDMGESAGFGGGNNNKFGGFGGGMPSGAEFEQGPKSSLGGAWVGGNMISPRGQSNGAPFGGEGEGHNGMSEADGQSQGVTRLDAATIGARSRQLGIRPPPPQQMRGGPRGPITGAFNRFRPMMMGFRPPRRGPMGMPMPSMSEPMPLFKPQFPLSSRPKLHYIPMGGERDVELNAQLKQQHQFGQMGNNQFNAFQNPSQQSSMESNFHPAMMSHQQQNHHNFNMFDSYAPNMAGHAWKK